RRLDLATTFALVKVIVVASLRILKQPERKRGSGEGHPQQHETDGGREFHDGPSSARRTSCAHRRRNFADSSSCFASTTFVWAFSIRVARSGVAPRRVKY